VAKKTTGKAAPKRKPATSKNSASSRSGAKTAVKASGTPRSAKSPTKSAKSAGKGKAGGPKPLTIKPPVVKVAAKHASAAVDAKTALTGKSKGKTGGTPTDNGSKGDAAGAKKGASSRRSPEGSKKSKGAKRGRSVAEAASDVTADSKGYVFINGRRVRMISTKGQAPAKKPRNSDLAPVAAASDKPPIQSIKTDLSRKELTHYRELLLQKRRELVGDLHAMESQALRSGGGNLSHMPIHMADIGTDTYDQDFMLGLAEAERKQLREIDAALQRIEDRTYGVCQMTGNMIPKTRLDAKPWAKHTIEAARKLEGQWGA
jgi:DnaK suppressor protein